MKLLQYPNKILLQMCKSYQFGKNDEKMRRKIVDMYKIMEQNNGIGLSACQIGWPVRIFILKTSNRRQEFINPSITSISYAKTIMNEGCLSHPNVFKDIERPSEVELCYTDMTGKIIFEKFDELHARIILHEMCHLNGIDPFEGKYEL